ncbi:MAG: Rpn family recombination-promoting nuclease/putative transposase [Clostridia bacterium]|nr:Rpn family recombination-promoting nuclease/putative transposase [Clostridia bacterium]
MLKPTNDFVFKRIFGVQKNSDLLKDLLEGILPDIKIKKVKVNKDVSLERKQIAEKLGILDVIATLNDNTIVNIEMQVKDPYNTIERSLFYGTGIYHENLFSGQDYAEVPRSISIWITDYNVFDEGPFHEKARIKRDYENIVLTDKLELHYIQLPKFRKKCKRISSKLEEWLSFIKYDNMEELHMIKNEKIKKAEEELEYLTGDEEAKRLAYLREKAIRDEYNSNSMARKIGIEEGIKKGEQESRIKIAKKMLAEKVDIELICKITELTKEEIEKL